MTEVRIEHASGAEDYVTHIEDKVERKVDDQDVARILTLRQDAQDANLELNDDHVFVVDGGVDDFGGVLTNTVGRGKRTELVVKSFQELAKVGEPFPAKAPFLNQSDSSIVKTAMGSVPDLSTGTIDTLESGIDIVFHHATPALMVRLMRELSKAYVVYNADRTIDYTASLGSDKTGTTISPSNQNLTSARPTDDGGDQTYTHLRVIGGGGVSVDVVADSFNSSSDTERWGRAAFKEVTDPTILTRYGEALLSVLETKWVEVEATVTNLSPELGDTYHVSYPEEGIDDNLEVAELKTIRDKSGTHHELRLSNRTFARGPPAQQQNRRVEEAARTGQTSIPKNLPSATFQTFELPAGKYLDQGTIISRGSTLYLWKVTQVPANTDISLELIERPDSLSTEHYAESSLESDEGSPLASITASGADVPVAFRVRNGGSDSVNTSAEFYYTIETA